MVHSHGLVRDLTWPHGLRLNKQFTLWSVFLCCLHCVFLRPARNMQDPAYTSTSSERTKSPKNHSREASMVCQKGTSGLPTCILPVPKRSHARPVRNEWPPSKTATRWHLQSGAQTDQQSRIGGGRNKHQHSSATSKMILLIERP